MGRAPCCDEAAVGGVTKGPWAPEEDERLRGFIERHGGHGSWRALPKLAGLRRCGKSCRLRWTNYLRPNIKRGRFTGDEEQQIIELHATFGNKWSAIASRLPGRTDNEIKNYWNTHLRKKLLQMGIDPVTHRPRPDLQLLANLPGLLTSATNLTALAGLLQADAAQLATCQLFTNILHVLIGSSSTVLPPSNSMEEPSVIPENQYATNYFMTTIMNQQSEVLGGGLGSSELVRALVTQAPPPPLDLTPLTCADAISYPYMVPHLELISSDGRGCSDDASGSYADPAAASTPSIIASALPGVISGGQTQLFVDSPGVTYESLQGGAGLDDDFFLREIIQQVSASTWQPTS